MNQLSVKQRYERIIDMINQNVTDYPKKEKDHSNFDGFPFREDTI